MNPGGQEGKVHCQNGYNKLVFEDCLGQVEKGGVIRLVPPGL